MAKIKQKKEFHRPKFYKLMKKLCESDLEAIYKPAREMQLVDSLSRIFVQQGDEVAEKIYEINSNQNHRKGIMKPVIQVFPNI